MLHVGMIGSGIMSEIHAQNFSQIPDVTISAVYSTDTVSAIKLAKKHGATLFKSFDDLLNYQKLDVVAICTPTPSHKDYAVAALLADKHVFLEKPIARTLEDGKQLLETGAKAKGKFMVGFVVRFCHEYAHAKKLIEDGTIGKVGVVRTARRAHFPIGLDNWYGNAAQSGGVILDMLIHDMDYLRWCFGEIKQIYAKNLLHKLNDKIDYALVMMRFTNGVIAHLEGSWAFEGEFHTAFEIAGDKGIIDFNSLTSNPVNVYVKQNVIEQDRVAVPEPPVLQSPYFLEDLYFINCIQNDKIPMVSVKEGYEALRIGIAALESAQSKKVINL